MDERERIKLIDVGLRVLNIQVHEHSLKMILRLNNLLNENHNPTIKDILNIKTKNK
jgi:hypothetical protein